MLHFACIYNTRYDMDMIYHFVPYYTSLGFDSMKVFIHNVETTGGQRDIEFLIRIFTENGILYEIVNGKFDSTLRKNIFSTYSKSFPVDSHLIAVESNEIIIFPEAIKTIIDSYDIFRGLIINKTSSLLHAANRGSDIKDQFPLNENDSIKIKDSITDPTIKQSFPIPDINRVIIAKAGLDVDYSDSLTYKGNDLIEYPDNLQVLKFDWRSSSVNKCASKDIYSYPHVQAIIKYFKIDSYYSKEVKEKEVKESTLK